MNYLAVFMLDIEDCSSDAGPKERAMTMEWINTCAADVNTWAEPFEHIVLGFASLVGGAWIILRLVRERKWDSALAIDIKSSFVPTETRVLTFLEVRLRNKGKVQLRAKVHRSQEGLACAMVLKTSNIVAA